MRDIMRWRPPVGPRSCVGELVNQIRAAADPNFRTAVSKMLPAVWRVLARCGVPEPELDDGAQQVFLQAARHWDRLGLLDDRQLRNYLCCAATGVAINTGKRLARERERITALSTDLPDGGADPAERVQQIEARRTLDRILHEMPESRRLVFVLFELEGFSGQEIAEYLELPVGTVASRLRRAREDFRRAVGRLRARDSKAFGDFSRAGSGEVS